MFVSLHPTNSNQNDRAYETDNLMDGGRADGRLCNPKGNASAPDAMQEFASQEHEKETTTETITTWVDSLGREIRQEQRTTQREISKQEQQRTQQLLQQWQSEMQRQLTTMDSAWHSRLSVMERHLSDSLTATLDKQSQTSAAPALTWWQKTRAWICGALIGIVIGVVVMLTKKYWTKWIKI